jgi:4-diphosphocytidyl-2C-methyl-D-erythritol kinase
MRPIRIEDVMSLGNTFEEVLPVAARVVASIRRRFQNHGALGVRLTGSGSAVFGAFESTASLSSLVKSLDPERYRVHVVTPTGIGNRLFPLT